MVPLVIILQILIIDIIYARNNNLELYNKHFNTSLKLIIHIIIFTILPLDDILQKISDANILEENLRLSIILHKDISDLLLDINNIDSETELPPNQILMKYIIKF